MSKSEGLVLRGVAIQQTRCTAQLHEIVSKAEAHTEQQKGIKAGVELEPWWLAAVHCMLLCNADTLSCGLCLKSMCPDCDTYMCLSCYTCIMSIDYILHNPA